MANSNLVEIGMVITKASVQADGTMRWSGVVSDILPDNTGESTSIALFQDWIDRVEKNTTVPFLPPPRKPFLGISHYPDLGGEGEAGITEKMYIDGNRFKASGIFYDTLLGRALFNAVKSEMDLVKRGQAVEKPIRISAAWWDIQHSHGPHIFTRRSLSDACPMCEAGESSNKQYLAGQPDHFASTRVPINPRTSLLTERSDTMTITRREDALSIVGEEEADKLESKSQLVGKSETETGPALVFKAKPAPKDDEEEEIEEAEDEEKGKKKPPPFTKQKAFTLADARTVATKSYSRLELVGMVKRNIGELPEGEQLSAMSALLDEMHNEITQIKEAVEDVWLLQPIQEQEEVNEMDFLQTFTEQVTQALDAEGTKEQKAAVIQEALNGVAVALKAELEGPVPSGDMVAAFKAALSPLTDQIAQLNARLGVTQAPIYQAPIQRSVTNPQINTQQPASALPVSPITGQESALTQMVRRSVGLY